MRQGNWESVSSFADSLLEYTCLNLSELHHYFISFIKLILRVYARFDTSDLRCYLHIIQVSMSNRDFYRMLGLHDRGLSCHHNLMGCLTAALFLKVIIDIIDVTITWYFTFVYGIWFTSQLHVEYFNTSVVVSHLTYLRSLGIKMIVKSARNDGQTSLVSKILRSLNTPIIPCDWEFGSGFS